MSKRTAGVSMVTRSKKAKDTEEGQDLKPEVKRSRISSLMKIKTALPPRGTTPIWIRYYDHESKDPSTDYGRGFCKPLDFFERLMEEYVSSNDNFFDTLKQNPEACTVIYTDGGGRMRALHHLTAENHGKPIIVGLEGFGSMSEVKAVHEELIVDRMLLGDKEGNTTVPDLDDFLTNDAMEDIDTSSKVDPGDGVSEFTSLSQIFASQPKGYLIHPSWLPMIHTTIGLPPEIMGKALVEGLKRKSAKLPDPKEAVKKALDDAYPFLVFLWACHHKLIHLSDINTAQSL